MCADVCLWMRFYLAILLQKLVYEDFPLLGAVRLLAKVKWLHEEYPKSGHTT